MEKFKNRLLCCESDQQAENIKFVLMRSIAMYPSRMQSQVLGWVNEENWDSDLIKC